MKRQSLLILTIILLASLQSLGQTTQNYIPKFSNSSGAINNSIIYQNGYDKIGINTNFPEAMLQVSKMGVPPLDATPNLKIHSMYFYLSTPNPTGQISIPIIGTASINFDIASNNLSNGSVADIIAFRNLQNDDIGLYFQVANKNIINLRSNEIYLSENTGIGITPSDSRLHVNSKSGQAPLNVHVDGSTKFKVHSNGSISVGAATTGPANGMYVNGNISVGTTSSSSRLQVNSTSGQAAFIAQVNGSNKLMVNSNGSVSVGSATTGPANGMYVSGSIGIGTTNVNDYKLAIAGKMIAEEVVVKLQANWPDYVFEEDYNLKQLDEVKDYIKEYKHLPNIPTATEIAEKGISLGTINTILVEKIEELTLYLIEHQQVISELKEKVKDLENEIRCNE